MDPETARSPGLERQIAVVCGHLGHIKPPASRVRDRSDQPVAGSRNLDVNVPTNAGIILYHIDEQLLNGQPHGESRFIIDVICRYEAGDLIEDIVERCHISGKGRLHAPMLSLSPFGRNIPRAREELASLRERVCVTHFDLTGPEERAYPLAVNFKEGSNMVSLQLASYSRTWWAVLVRGLIAALFGIIAIANPGGTVEFMVRLVGIFVLVAGLVGAIAAMRHREGSKRADWFVVPAVIAIIVGLVLIFAPKFTATLLIFLIGLAALIYGIWEIYNFMRIHRHIASEWMPLLVGLVAIVAGILFMAKSRFIVEAAVWLLGVVALIMGILWIALAFRARTWGRFTEAKPVEAKPAEPPKT